MKIPNAVCMHIVAGSGGVEKPPFDYLGHRRDMSDRHFSSWRFVQVRHLVFVSWDIPASFEVSGNPSNLTL